MLLDEKKIKQLEDKAFKIRTAVVQALEQAGSGHTAGPLGMADIFAYLFFHTLRHNPKKPDWPERDRLILSNGHICPALYAVMALAGYAPLEEFTENLRKFGSRFQGHPDRSFFHALETTSGPLGSGLSQAVGMALGQKIDRGKVSGKFFYCLMSDAELQSGATWEAAMLAGKERLGNLIAIVDRNHIQISGYTEDVMPIEPLIEKWRAWNWHISEVNGHDFLEIDEAVNSAKTIFGQPSVIIAHTIPGKGVSEFERKYEWHGKPPNKEEAEMALHDLRTFGGKVRHD